MPRHRKLKSVTYTLKPEITAIKSSDILPLQIVGNSYWGTKHANTCNLCSNDQLNLEETSILISAHKLIKDSGMFNFQSCKIPVPSKLNLDYI